MTGHDFKRTGVLRGGFEYQDLVAVEILIEFLRNPSLYEWVQVEAEDKTYQAIDDVVACRKDGQLELIQVKFTPDPPNPNRGLSWAWLTEHTPRGTSFLQKWAETVLAHRSNGTLALAMLKTDRIPDQQFAECLDGQHVDYRRLTSETKTLIDGQLGSEEEAVAFFKSFEFVHSMERFDDYEAALRARLQHDTDKGGWAHFRQEVRCWAMRKNKPPPDGKIRHFHLLGVFAPDRPVALRQDFAVPPGYRFPDDGFHQRFIGEARAADGISVLWGPPGRGKSTYLSHCVFELARKDDVVCIRHHYFLRLDERGEGRFSYFAIERSLIQQLLEADLPGAQQKDGLAHALAAAASELRQSGRRLVVVVDGLDHVWRDQGDTAQMQLLFDALLPLPEGVRLLVGTQSVENEHLPRKLLRALPKDRWTELPTMSVAAVREWVASRAAGDRVRVVESPVKTDEEVIDELGSALHGISAGLPLHLVYSLEALVKSGEPLTVDAVLQLPACPSGEIEDYYETLWVGLGGDAKRVLHLLAGLKFRPPSFGLGTCLNADVSWWDVLEEIGHLLDCREASVVPFHGSLFAFLRDRSDHRQAFLSLAPNVLTWLEEESPEYWRRAWLWVTRADLGNGADLVQGPSRDWSIDWLASGYPVDQLVYILNRAEEAALDTFDLPRLIRLRCLKTRALNARKYQSNEWGSFWETSLALSRDQDLGSVLWDGLPGLEMEELPAVADFGPGVPADAGERVIDELNRRNAMSSSGDDQGHWDAYSRAVVRVAAHQPKEQAERVIEYARDSGAEDLIDVYTSESLAVGNHDHVFAVGLRRRTHRLDRDTFAALCLEGIGPGAKPGLAADRPALRCLVLLTNGESTACLDEADVSHLWNIKENFGVGYAVREGGHDVFFTSLAAALSGKVAVARANVGEEGNGTWLGDAIRALERMAATVGSGWLAARRWPRLGDIYQTFKLALPSEPSLWEQSAIGGVRLALQDIAVDLCLLATGILGQPNIDGQDVRAADASPLWSMEAWLETFCDRRLRVHSAQGGDALLDLVAAHLDARVVEFGERAAIAARAARFALDHGLHERCREVLRRTADCLLGYGYRKDVFVFEVLSALRLLADRRDEEARQTFLLLAREVEAITDYTDGDETIHARTELHLGIAELFPDRVPALYAELVAAQEWYRAEELAKIWAGRISANSKTGRMLLSTLIAPGEFNAAWEAAETMTEDGTSIRETLGRLTGRDRPLSKDRHGTSGSTSDEPRETPDVSGFEPGRLADFVRTVREERFLYGSGAVSQWLAHWDDHGRYAEALGDLHKQATDRRARYHVAEALDTAFEISRNRQGRSEAYVWLVRAMVENRGWVSWWSSDARFRQRVRAVVQDYAQKWREFVVATSRTEPLGELEDNGIAVGLSRLVYFLIEVGESDLAKRCAMEMVEVYQDEVSEQPLAMPDWAR